MEPLRGMQASAGIDAGTESEMVRPSDFPPWQIWIVIILLGLEGIGNLLSAFDHPIALYWLAAKCFFIFGMLKRWFWVYALFMAFAFIHVVYFAFVLPVAAAMNLLLIVLTIWGLRVYFSGQSR